jgi:hypothetical protein
MNKQTKMIVGVGAVAIVGYLVWKQMSKPKPAAFANLTSSKLAGGAPGCPCGAAAPDQSGAAPGWTICAGSGSDGKPDKMCRTIKAATTTTGSFAGREF